MKSRVVEAYKEEKKVIYNKRLGVIFNGEDNLKPLIVENLIANSPTATQCAWLYQRFLGGGGFEVDLTGHSFSDLWNKKTPDDLLFDACDYFSNHRGAFVHVRYNANFEKIDFKVVPYSLCRVGKKDDDNYSGKIVVSPNGWGRLVKKDELDVFNVYNPNPDIIQLQVEDAGGWHNYKGQIMFIRLDDKSIYPDSPIETAYTFADVENQIGLFYNSTVKRGFKDIFIVRHKPFSEKTDESDFVKNAEKVTGVENASSVWMIEDNWDGDDERQGNIRFDKISSDEKPDRYAHFETSAANYIRKAFYNIPPQLVDYVQGKLGNTTGEDLLKAQSIYNATTARDRLKIETAFKELFRNYKDNINPSDNWSIKLYSLLQDGTIDN